MRPSLLKLLEDLRLFVVILQYLFLMAFSGGEWLVKIDFKRSHLEIGAVICSNNE